jgi:hypothetical protein
MDSAKIRQLQELLVAPAPIVAARSERRRRVEQALDQVVGAFGEGDLPLGEWERRCVLLALGAMRDGFYDIAMFHVQSVLVADEQRARQGHMSRMAELSLDEIREELELTRDWPI